MRKIEIFDTSLRDWAQTAGVNMTPEVKIEIAKKIDELWIPMIEAWFAISSIWDQQAIRTISEEVSARVYSLSRLMEWDINVSHDVLSESTNRWIHTFIWTSPMHRNYKLHKTKAEILEDIDRYVSYARNKFNSSSDAIMFSPEDALRTENDFLFQTIETAIKAWANQINIPDTVWFSQPMEIWVLMKDLVNSYPWADFSVHTHNDLWNAVANSLAAAYNWANIIQWTIPPAYWERAWNADLIQVLMNIIKRPDIYDFDLGNKLDMKKVSDLVMFISNSIWKRVSDNHPIIWSDVFKHSSWIHQDWTSKNKTTYEIISPEEIWYKIEQSFILTNQSWRSWLNNAIVVYFGVQLTSDTLNEVFTKFKEISSTNSGVIVTMDDIREILLDSWVNLKRNIYINDYSITIDTVHSKASIELTHDWEVVTALSNWVGPVDAIYNAIIDALGMSDLNLIDFNISALSSSPSSEAKVSIKVESDWRIYEEFWVDKDIVKASINAFVNCLDRVSGK